jgi:hypothetical protein
MRKLQMEFKHNLRVIKKLMLILCLSLISNMASAQTYRLVCPDGKTALVHLFHKPASEQLLITCLNDTLQLNDFWSLDTVSVQGKAFLKIDYAIRVGSNQGRANQLWLFVDHGKLRQALQVNSLSNVDFRPREYHVFNLKSALKGNNSSTYQLRLKLHDVSWSPTRRKSNKNESTILRFDLKHQCFYSYFTKLKGVYTIHNAKGRQSIKTNFSQTVPVVDLMKTRYYYINGGWYTMYKNEYYDMI